MGPLETACELFCAQVNARPHQVTRRAPGEMLVEERGRLHPLPAAPFSAAFGVTRTVGVTTPMVAFDNGSYSVPHQLAGQTVWVRRHGDDIVIVACGPEGPAEVARHPATTPGSPRVAEAHFPPAPEGALGRTPKARTAAEMEFLALGEPAALWLTEAAAAGTTRIRVKMAEIVALAKLLGAEQVGRAVGHAAVTGRFAEGDVAALVAHHATTAPGPSCTAGEDHTLAQGTTGWAGFGGPTVTR